jgi:hypothetical protein
LYGSHFPVGAFSLSRASQTAVFALLLKVLPVWPSQRTPLDRSAAGDDKFQFSDDF